MELICPNCILYYFFQISPNISENNQEFEDQIKPIRSSQDHFQKFVETVDTSTNTEEEFFLKTDIIPYFSHTFCDELKELFGNSLVDLHKNSIVDKINLSWNPERDNYQNNLSNEFGIGLLTEINAEALHFLIKALVKRSGLDFNSYQDKKFDFNKHNSIDNLKANIWKLDLSKDSNILYQKTEKLIPVMDVTTNSNIEKPIVKLRRTYSVCSDMDGRKQKIYGSHETLTSTAAGKGEKMRKSQSTTLRKTSFDKSTQSLKNLLLRKEDDKKGQLKVEAKVDSIRKIPGKPRSEIVAAVTQRLYTKAKKKEIATETDEIPKENKATMARPRLQDITQRAIRYYKRRHMETQTEADPVMRVKDISTDVEDLKLDLLVVKHANIATDITRNRDTGTTCNLLGGFDNHDLSSLKLTSSCGVQVDDSTEGKKSKAEDKTPNLGSNNLISFTKYLRGNEAKSAKPNSTSPIYTSSVNINVSHNYINGNSSESTIHKAGSISGDSLDDQNLQNLCFPTPDLLSNHNSLEQPQSVQEVSAIKDKDELNYALSDDIPVEYNVNEEFESNFGESCNARYSLVPQLIEQVDVGIPPVYAPEIHLIKKSERCNFLNNAHPKLYKPNIIQGRSYLYRFLIQREFLLFYFQKITISALPSPLRSRKF